MARAAATRVLVLLALAGCADPPPAPVTRAAAGVAPGPAVDAVPEARSPDAGRQQPDAAAPAVVEPAPPAAAGPPLDITFDDIKLDMQKGAPFTRDLLPRRVTDLDRRAVRIRGYILPSFKQAGITEFVLVRDNQECCFGPGAALHDCVVVRMRPGKTTNFSIRPVAVAGTFRVDELRGADGKHLAIYALDGEEVR